MAKYVTVYNFDWPAARVVASEAEAMAMIDRDEIDEYVAHEAGNSRIRLRLLAVSPTRWRTPSRPFGLGVPGSHA